MTSDALVAGIGDVVAASAADREQPQGDQAAFGTRAERFAFTGAGAEYFGIWIVNLLLSIVTLGIYSAWATVRSKRYFYGNTVLDGVGFDYLARPAQILKGRLLMVAFFFTWSAISQALPLFDAVMLLLVLPVVVPWAVVRSRKFAARCSAYRSLRFDFDGTKRQAFFVYVLLSAGSVLTVGLLYPYAVYRRKRFQIEHGRFGRAPFAFSGSAKPFYRIYFMAIGLAVPLAIISGALLEKAFGLLTLLASDDPSALIGGVSPDVLLSALAIVISLASIIAVSVYLQTAVDNEVWNHASVGPHRFRLDLEYLRMLWIQLSNMAAIVLSAGLMIPWAKVRTARYKVERLSLLVAGNLDDFVAEEVKDIGATGSELGEGLDLDVGW